MSRRINLTNAGGDRGLPSTSHPRLLEGTVVYPTPGPAVGTQPSPRIRRNGQQTTAGFTCSGPSTDLASRRCDVRQSCNGEGADTQPAQRRPQARTPTKGNPFGRSRRRGKSGASSCKSGHSRSVTELPHKSGHPVRRRREYTSPYPAMMLRATCACISMHVRSFLMKSGHLARRRRGPSSTQHLRVSCSGESHSLASKLTKAHQ